MGDSAAATALATIDTPPRSMSLLRIIAAPEALLAQQEETRKLIKEILQEGRDYGVIKGIDKPSLLKPGAERIGIAFGCYARFKIVEREIDHDKVVEWKKSKRKYNNAHDGDDSYTITETTGTSLGLYRYVTECEIVHRESGQIVGNCIGVCSTMESKYVDRPRDSENTALKMSEKRAHVGAVLNAFGLSEQFTQDVEDTGEPAAQGDSKAGKPAVNESVSCPKCGGRMWDNRLTKRNAKAPDYKCQNRSCDGVLWPPKPAGAAPEGEAPARSVEDSQVKPAPAAKPPAPAVGVYPVPGPLQGIRYDERDTDGSYRIATELVTRVMDWASGKVAALAGKKGQEAAREDYDRIANEAERELERRTDGAQPPASVRMNADFEDPFAPPAIAGDH